MTNQCEHGQLARVCELCAKDAEIAQLRADNARLQNEVVMPLPEPVHGFYAAPMYSPDQLRARDLEVARLVLEAAAAEIAQLRQYLDTAQRRASALGDEVAGLREDAERYRWLRDHSCPQVMHPSGYGMGNARGEQLDAAIDAALAARKGEA